MAALGWSVQHDLGSRLPVADAIALLQRIARDPASMLAEELKTNSAQIKESERRQKLAASAEHMSGPFAHLFR